MISHSVERSYLTTASVFSGHRSTIVTGHYITISKIGKLGTCSIGQHQNV